MFPDLAITKSVRLFLHSNQSILHLVDNKKILRFLNSKLQK